MRKIALAGLLFLAVGPALAESDPPKLEGTVFLDEEACAKGTSAPDCVLSFDIQGAAAKILYNGLPGKGKHEECTGGMEKSDGKGLHCIKGTDGTFSCDFGYQFKKKAFTGSHMDC